MSPKRRLKFKLQAVPIGVAITACTPIDHVFPRSVRDTFCFCGERRWGRAYQSNTQAFALNDKGHVRRRVRMVSMRKPPDKDRPHYSYVLFLQGCGHIAFKKADAPTKYKIVRCRLCEKRYVEILEKKDRVEAKKARREERKKKTEEKRRWREQQGKSLRVKLKRRVARKDGRGTGGSKTRTFVIRRSGARKRG